MKYNIAVIPGDGIGPEVIDQAKKALNAIADVYNHIFNEWLLNTDYELRDEPVRERYISNPERVAEDKLKTEFYIPIK